jgi:hypothetical protein
MAYLNGFQYVSGPHEEFLSTISSTATFKQGVPLTYGLGRTLIEATSRSSQIVGIAMHDAANSIYPGLCSVLKVLPNTVFAVKIQAGVATSATSAGQSYGLEKSGNYLRPDTDSQTTPMVVILPRQDGTTVDSTDSSVWCSFLLNVAGPFASSASTNYAV